MSSTSITDEGSLEGIVSAVSKLIKVILASLGFDGAPNLAYDGVPKGQGGPTLQLWVAASPSAMAVLLCVDLTCSCRKCIRVFCLNLLTSTHKHVLLAHIAHYVHGGRTNSLSLR